MRAHASTVQRNARSRLASTILYLILSFGKRKLPASQFLAAAAALVCVMLSLLLPGLALRFSELSALRLSLGAPDRAITMLFAASTPIIIASRAKTILVYLFAVSFRSPRLRFCDFRVFNSPALFSFPFRQALLQPNAAQSYAIATYFLQACALPHTPLSIILSAISVYNSPARSQFFGSAARTFTTYKELVQTAESPDYLRLPPRLPRCSSFQIAIDASLTSCCRVRLLCHLRPAQSGHPLPGEPRLFYSPGCFIPLLFFVYCPASISLPRSNN